ncbi:MAG: hypothetical protein FWE70_08790, partial [Oscillospiraceae bacterium]|nr:hypothetical protein [Oscillospiraceae bacterium]
MPIGARNLNDLPKTPTLGLYLPTKGYPDWDVPAGENFNMLDKAIRDIYGDMWTGPGDPGDPGNPDLPSFDLSAIWAALSKKVTMYDLSGEGVIDLNDILLPGIYLREGGTGANLINAPYRPNAYSAWFSLTVERGR